MEFVAAKCPNCAGELRLPDDKTKVKCMYCGFDVLVKDAIAAGPSLENLKQLAFAAEADGNYEESYEYFKRVLELDPRNFDALLGKAIAAENLYSYNFVTHKSEGPPQGWSSVNRFIGNLPAAEREALKQKIGPRIYEHSPGALGILHNLDPKDEEVLTALYKSSKSQADKYSGELYGSETFSGLKEEFENDAREWLSKLRLLNPDAAAVAEKEPLAKPETESVRPASTGMAIRDTAATEWIIAIFVVSIIVVAAAFFCSGGR
jgi:tetratricopeptide (TPR) repeat protein